MTNFPTPTTTDISLVSNKILQFSKKLVPTKNNNKRLICIIKSSTVIDNEHVRQFSCSVPNKMELQVSFHGLTRNHNFMPAKRANHSNITVQIIKLKTTMLTYLKITKTKKLCAILRVSTQEKTQQNKIVKQHKEQSFQRADEQLYNNRQKGC